VRALLVPPDIFADGYEFEGGGTAIS